MFDFKRFAALLSLGVCLFFISAAPLFAQGEENGTFAGHEAKVDPILLEADAITDTDGPRPKAGWFDGAKEMDLAAAVKASLGANPRMESAEAQKDAARAGRISSFGAMLPQATVGYRYNYSDPPRAKGVRKQSSNNLYTLYFNIHQDLFTGFRKENQFLKARIEERKSGANKANEELSLILTVQENFLGLLKARESVRSAQDSVTRLKSQLKVTQAFYEVGLKPRLDVLQAEVELANAEDTLLQAENGVDTQIARLNTLLDQPLEERINYSGELGYIPMSMSLNDCLQKAYKNRPDLMMYQHNVDIARKDARIAESALYPQLSADVNWQQTGDHPNVQGDSYSNATRFDDWTFQVGVQWLIFDFGSTWFSSRQAREMVRKYVADAANQKLEATFDVKSRHLKISETKKRIKVAQKALEQAKEGFRMAVARYQAQVGTNTDVLDAQSRLTEAEASLTNAMADYQIALANLYVSIGERNLSLSPLE